MKVNQSRRTATITLLLIYVTQATNGQLTFRQDGQQNSYSVAAPGSQISFSRFYGGQAGQLLAQPSQPTQAQAPTQFLGQGQVFEQGNQLQYATSPVGQNPAQVFYTQNGELGQQTQQLNPVNNDLQTLDLLRQQYQQQLLLQQQQQQQLQQQQIQQQEFFRQQNQQTRHHNLVAEQQARSQLQAQQPLQANAVGQQQQQLEQQQQPTPENQQQLLGTLFSPSNEVSQVKFSSSGLNYTF